LKLPSHFLRQKAPLLTPQVHCTSSTVTIPPQGRPPSRAGGHYLQHSKHHNLLNSEIYVIMSFVGPNTEKHIRLCCQAHRTCTAKALLTTQTDTYTLVMRTNKAAMRLSEWGGASSSRNKQKLCRYAHLHTKTGTAKVLSAESLVRRVLAGHKGSA
jgi:hypothetical protein